MNTFEYRGKTYPTYLRDGNAMQFIAPVALRLCKGTGLDVGCGDWPLPGAVGIDRKMNLDVNAVPRGPWDYIFSSHLLEHLANPVNTLEHWQANIKPGGVLFLYLPHPDMVYWRPENCRKHLHSWYPIQMAKMLESLGFVDVMHSERDMMWSFAVVAAKLWVPITA